MAKVWYVADATKNIKKSIDIPDDLAEIYLVKSGDVVSKETAQDMSMEMANIITGNKTRHTLKKDKGKRRS